METELGNPPTPARARPPVPATNIAWQGQSPAGHFPVEKAPRISWKGKGNGHSRCYQSLRVITSYHNLLQSLSNHHWLLGVILRLPAQFRADGIRIAHIQPMHGWNPGRRMSTAFAIRFNTVRSSGGYIIRSAGRSFDR